MLHVGAFFVDSPACDCVLIRSLCNMQDPRKCKTIQPQSTRSTQRIRRACTAQLVARMLRAIQNHIFSHRVISKPLNMSIML